MTGAGNWTWLLPGRVPTLIDAGTGKPEHLDAVADALEGATLAQVLVTHAHSDHASGAPAMAAAHPQARFAKMPWAERDSKWPVAYQPLGDGDVVEAGDDVLVAVHTPGHAPDHLSFWHEPSRTLFCGDLALKSTTVYIPHSLGGDLAAYLASLERVLALRPLRLLPAHGAVIENPETLLRTYIAHRLEREQQVLDAVRSGHRSADAIAALLYKGFPDAMLPVAADGVAAHLAKLQREGRIREEGGAWVLVDS